MPLARAAAARRFLADACARGLTLAEASDNLDHAAQEDTPSGGSRFALECALADALTEHGLSARERALAAYVLAEARALPETRQERAQRRAGCGGARDAEAARGAPRQLEAPAREGGASEATLPAAVCPFAPFLARLASAAAGGGASGHAAGGDGDTCERRLLATLLLQDGARVATLHASSADEALRAHASTSLPTLSADRAAATAGWPAAEAARPAAAAGVVEELGQIGEAAHAAGGGRSDGPPLLLPSLLGAGGAEAAWPHACPPLPFAWSGEGSARRLEADGREEAMRAALLSAARSPLSPPAERALIARMRSDPALTRGAAPEPVLVVGVVEANPMAAVELLDLVLPDAPDARRLLDGLASAPLSLHALEVVNRLAAREGSPLADAFVRAFASRCMRECEPPRQGEARGGQLVPDSGSAMAGSAPQPRLVRMVCVLLQGLVTSGPHRFDRAHLAEMQAFSAAFSRVREAASLYRQLCGVRL